MNSKQSLTKPQETLMQRLRESLSQKTVYSREAFGGRVPQRVTIDGERVSPLVFKALVKNGALKCVQEEAFIKEYEENI